MNEQFAWLFVVLVLLFVILWFLRESKSLEPVETRLQVDWRQYCWASGDLLLFSGMGWLGRVGEAVLKLCGRCRYTHVGLIYVDPNPEHNREVYVWEMKNASLGTRLTPIQRVMQRYRGRLAVRPLFGPANRRGVSDTKLRTFIRSRWGLDYAYDFWFYSYNRLFPSLPMPAWSAARERPVRFCSDLVSETLYAVGVLDYSHNPNQLHEAIPRDFAEATQKLPLSEGWTYGSEVLLLGTKEMPLPLSQTLSQSLSPTNDFRPPHHPTQP